MKPSQAPRYEGATQGLLAGYCIKVGLFSGRIDDGYKHSRMVTSADGHTRPIALLLHLVWNYTQAPYLSRRHERAHKMGRSNKRRNTKYGPPNQEAAALAGMEDKTEFENKDFRYVL